MNPVLVGQYSYTACEAAGPYSAVPGWKVKQVLSADFGGPVPEAAVKEAVRPFGGFRTPIIGPLTTQDEIDHLPRCLRLDVLSGEFRGLAHLAAAGRDRSGRDAFFAHGLLIGPPDAASTTVTGLGAIWNRYRPADFWAADGWLTPFRAEAIEVAELGVLPAVSAASPFADDLRMDFIDLHPGQREFVLAAAERAFTAQTPIVVVGLPVEAAMWTSIVTHFLLPSTGWTVPFSTYEAAPAAEVLRARSATVIGAPADNAAGWRQIPDDQVTVLDPEHPAGRTDDGFVLPAGTVLPVGPWARLAEAACELGWEDEVRRRIDALGERVGAELDPWPLFALPAVLLSLPESTLLGHREVARQAARALTAEMPPVSMLPPDLTTDLIAAITRWGDSGATASTTRDILMALDRSAGAVPTDVTDPILLAYLREVFSGPEKQAAPAWFPGQIALSEPAQQQLGTELAGLIGWIDGLDPGVRARAVLSVAGQLEKAGMVHGAVLVDVRAALDERIRELAPLLLDRDGPTADGADDRVPLPRWLWPGVLSEAVTQRLTSRRAGDVLWNPRLRRLVDAAARPLPDRYEPGRTCADLTLLDGERAAAVLLVTDRSSIDPARLEVLQTAAFLRSVLTRPVPVREASGSLLGELQRWFATPPRSVVFYDLLNRLSEVGPADDLVPLTSSVLMTLAPDRTTAAIAELLIRKGLLTSASAAGPLGWHVQFQRVLPLSSHQGHQTVWPDHPENELLKAVAAGRVHAGFREAGLTRLSWWLLLVAADQLNLPGNQFRMESAKWFTDAEKDPLGAAVNGLLPSIAGRIVRRVEQHQGAADDLAAEWATRAALAQLQVPGDPARPFFADASAASGWFVGARTMLKAADRPKDQLERWLELVRRSATLAGAKVYVGQSDAAARDSLLGVAHEVGTQLAGLGGMMGWLRRSTPVRRG